MKKIFAVFVVALVSILVAWAMDQTHCLFNNCVEDDASIRADALIGLFVLPVYVIFTLAVIFTSAISLRNALGIYWASFIPAIIVAVFISAIMFNSSVDNGTGIAGVLAWFSVPWFVANLIGLTIWPNHSPAIDGAKNAPQLRRALG